MNAQPLHSSANVCADEITNATAAAAAAAYQQSD